MGWADRLQWRDRIRPETLSRLISFGLMAGTGVVLGVAAWLTPDPSGHGTHTQLGLNSCTFLQITGFPCPMCGATTTFALLMHLHPLAAIVNQPFAAFLWLITVGVFGVSAAEVVNPRDRWTRILDRVAPWEGLLATAFLAFMGVAWVYKIVLMRFW